MVNCGYDCNLRASRLSDSITRLHHAQDAVPTIRLENHKPVPHPIVLRSVVEMGARRMTITTASKEQTAQVALTTIARVDHVGAQ